MFQGFYDLASNMITQNRNLNVISNNMTNVSTPGYKTDRVMQGTFKDQLLYRYDRYGKTPVGTVSRVNTISNRITDQEQAGLRETTNKLDFALDGKGFFAVRGENGIVYTRDGAFSLDDQGYLVLQGVGQVLGQDGYPIQLDTDNLYVDKTGYIFSGDGLRYYGQLQVVDFDNYDQMRKLAGGVFQGGGQMIESQAFVNQRMLEDSNVNMVQEMTSMMSSQRALQGSAQILKIYDQMANKAVQLGSF